MTMAETHSALEYACVQLDERIYLHPDSFVKVCDDRDGGRDEAIWDLTNFGSHSALF